MKLHLKEMTKEREKDLEMITQMVDGAHKKIFNDLAKKQQSIKVDIINLV